MTFKTKFFLSHGALLLCFLAAVSPVSLEAMGEDKGTLSPEEKRSPSPTRGADSDNKSPSVNSFKTVDLTSENDRCGSAGGSEDATADPAGKAHSPALGPVEEDDFSTLRLIDCNFLSELLKMEEGNSQNLGSLHVRGPIMAKEMGALTQAIRSRRFDSLTSLTLNSALTDDMVVALAQAIEGDDEEPNLLHLTHLELSAPLTPNRCSYLRDGLESLADVMSRLPLTYVNLSGYRLLGRGAGMGDWVGNTLASCLRDSSITHLNLYGCDLGPIGVESFSSALNNKPITVLEMGDNGMKDKGFLALFTALLSQKKSRLIFLGLSNNALEEASGHLLAGALMAEGKFPALITLDASKNYFEDANAKALASVIRARPSTFKIMNLKENTITPQGVQILRDAQAESTTAENTPIEILLDNQDPSSAEKP